MLGEAEVGYEKLIVRELASSRRSTAEPGLYPFWALIYEVCDSILVPIKQGNFHPHGINECLFTSQNYFFHIGVKLKNTLYCFHGNI